MLYHTGIGWLDGHFKLSQADPLEYSQRINAIISRLFGLQEKLKRSTKDTSWEIEKKIRETREELKEARKYRV